MTRKIRLQYSDSGAFSEPDNGVELYPLNMPVSKNPHKSVIKIPGRDGGITQIGGADNKRWSLDSKFMGDEGTRAIKEQALDNLVWHTDSDYHGSPLTLSDIYLEYGNTEDLYITAIDLGYRVYYFRRMEDGPPTWHQYDSEITTTAGNDVIIREIVGEFDDDGDYFVIGHDWPYNSISFKLNAVADSYSGEVEIQYRSPYSTGGDEISADSLNLPRHISYGIERHQETNSDQRYFHWSLVNFAPIKSGAIIGGDQILELGEPITVSSFYFKTGNTLDSGTDDTGSWQILTRSVTGTDVTESQYWRDLTGSELIEDCNEFIDIDNQIVTLSIDPPADWKSWSDSSYTNRWIFPIRFFWQNTTGTDSVQLQWIRISASDGGSGSFIVDNPPIIDKSGDGQITPSDLIYNYYSSTYSDAVGGLRQNSESSYSFTISDMDDTNISVDIMTHPTFSNVPDLPHCYEDVHINYWFVGDTWHDCQNVTDETARFTTGSGETRKIWFDMPPLELTGSEFQPWDTTSFTTTDVTTAYWWKMRVERHDWAGGGFITADWVVVRGNSLVATLSYPPIIESSLGVETDSTETNVTVNDAMIGEIEFEQWPIWKHTSTDVKAIYNSGYGRSVTLDGYKLTQRNKKVYDVRLGLTEYKG